MYRIVLVSTCLICKSYGLEVQPSTENLHNTFLHEGTRDAAGRLLALLFRLNPASAYYPSGPALVRSRWAVVSQQNRRDLPGNKGPEFKPVRTQFIAADPGMLSGTASSGTGASRWGIWRMDPGLRGVHLGNYMQLKESGFTAPAGWQLDRQDWWLDERGFVMEKPQFPIPSGKYLLPWLNGPIWKKMFRPVVLTIEGDRWELDKQATLHAVTHLPCRITRYTAIGEDASPEDAQSYEVGLHGNMQDYALHGHWRRFRLRSMQDYALHGHFPVKSGVEMPDIRGHRKEDHAMLLVSGLDKFSSLAHCEDKAEYFL